MVHRSHVSSAGPQPGAAPRPRAQPNGLLALQRGAGNRAVRALLARDKDSGFKPGVIQIGDERVRVATKAEQADAERIVGEMKTKYGVTFDSIAAQRTTRKHYGDMGAATDEQLKSVETRPWEYEELKAVERALAHFGPVLGERRKKSRLKSSPQEILTVGKLTTAPDDDPKHPEDKTRGEYFKEAQTFALFEPGPDGDTSPAGMEGRAVHEIAHGIFGSQLDAFMTATGYWEKLHVKREKRIEGPPDGYADHNASEDLAQSVRYFFTDPDRLKQGLPGREPGTPGNACPKRFAFIKGVVGGWTAK